MKIEDCQSPNVDDLFPKSIPITFEHFLVKLLRKLKYFLLVRRIKNSMGLKYYYSGKKATFSVEERATNTKPSLQVSNIKVGDYVKIRSKDEILETLNENNKLEGCFFMQEMFDHCDTKHRVIKKVENFYDEATSKMRRGRTTYLLEDLHCSGTLTGYWTQCDRNCYSFWKEAWIEKIE